MRYDPGSISLITNLPLLSVYTAGMVAAAGAEAAAPEVVDCVTEIAPAGRGGGPEGSGGAAGNAVGAACTLVNVTRAPEIASAVPIRTTMPSMDAFGDCCCAAGTCAGC